MKRHLIFLLGLMAPAVTWASGIGQLNQFLTSTKTAQAHFSQEVITKTGRTTQKANGTMSFQRPGKFRWEYIKPYNQLIVVDGTKLWSYDKDLNQVVIKPMGQVLGSTPAALLAGSNDLHKNFDLREDGASDGLEWVEATPRNKDSGFEKVRIGLKGNLPQAMEVQDNFGQTTELSFSDFERNPAFKTDLFVFTPPKGADVIGQ